jgi:hypothetical protein
MTKQTYVQEITKVLVNKLEEMMIECSELSVNVENSPNGDDIVYLVFSSRDETEIDNITHKLFRVRHDETIYIGKNRYQLNSPDLDFVKLIHEEMKRVVRYHLESLNEWKRNLTETERYIKKMKV